jgi:hypothetical protein
MPNTMLARTRRWRHAQKWYQTNHGQGQSLRTVADGSNVNTYLFKV